MTSTNVKLRFCVNNDIVNPVKSSKGFNKKPKDIGSAPDANGRRLFE
jgi:hypothetical protein